MTVNDEPGAVRGAPRGSVSDHLANERTHLAYVRTAISMFAFGITLHQFSWFIGEHRQIQNAENFNAGRHVGMGMVVFGIVLALWSMVRFDKVTHDIEYGTYRPNRKAMWVLALGVVLIGVTGAAWLWM